MAVKQLNKSSSVLSTPKHIFTDSSATMENHGIAWALDLEAQGRQELQLTLTALRHSPMFRYLVEFYNRDPRATASLQRYVSSGMDEMIVHRESLPIRLFAARMFLAGRLAEREGVSL